MTTQIDALMNSLMAFQLTVLRVGGVIALGAVVQLLFRWANRPPVKSVAPQHAVGKCSSKPATSAVQSAAERRRVAVARIHGVLGEYGQKLSDPAWMIEHQSIDKPTQYEAARAFTIASANVSDLDLGRVDVDTVERLSHELAMTWTAAVREADQVGYRALGDQAATGRRAVGLIRKTTDPSTSDLERAALRAKVDELLVICGIFLPASTRAALDSAAAPQLTAR